MAGLQQLHPGSAAGLRERIVHPATEENTHLVRQLTRGLIDILSGGAAATLQSSARQRRVWDLSGWAKGLLIQHEQGPVLGCHCMDTWACQSLGRAKVTSADLRPASLTCQSMVSCKTDEALSASNLSLCNSKLCVVLFGQCMRDMHQGTTAPVQLCRCRGDMGSKMGALHRQDGMSTQQQKRGSHLKLASRSSHSTFHFLDRHFTFHSGCKQSSMTNERFQGLEGGGTNDPSRWSTT